MFDDHDPKQTKLTARDIVIALIVLIACIAAFALLIWLGSGAG